ncbi:MAG: ribosome assembly RNA-binding protein YhbY [Gammaproteobacteria bacterium]
MAAPAKPATLSDKQKRYLRQLGHQLHPIVMTGNSGLTPAVLQELDRSLAAHELVKVRVRAGDREARDAIISEMCTACLALLVQRIGHVAVLYRQDPEKPKITLPRS